MVGFHFYKEGISKLTDPKPFSAMFFGGAKGPLAPRYHDLVWDADGKHRFNFAETSAAWENFVRKAERHYQFDDEQKTQAAEKLALRTEQLKQYLDGLGDDLDQYEKGLERRERERADLARREVPSLRGQSEKTETKLKADRGKWLSELDKLALDLERDMLQIGTREGQPRAEGAVVGASVARLKVDKPGRRPLDSEGIDQFIPYFDLTIGVLLMIGLFTRPVAVVAAGFLASVVASQWPGAYGAMPTYYQAVEMFALLALAALQAGRCGGLDAVVSGLWSCCCGPRVPAGTK